MLSNKALWLPFQTAQGTLVRRAETAGQTTTFAVQVNEQPCTVSKENKI